MIFSPQLILVIILVMKLLIPLILKLVVESRDSCCNTINALSKGHKTINVLTKGEEQENSLINLISQIDDPKLKEEYLKKLKKILVKDENDKKMKSKISLDETLERFN